MYCANTTARMMENTVIAVFPFLDLEITRNETLMNAHNNKMMFVASVIV